MNKYITFIRHAQVENPQQIIYGALPCFGLSKEGRENTKKKAVELAGIPYQKIIASPLERTKETAGIIQRESFPNLEITFNESIIEWVYITQGMSRQEWNSPQLASYKRVYDRNPYELPEEINGTKYESFTQLEKRMKEFLRQLLAESESYVLVVSHGDPILVLLSSLTGQTYQEFKSTNPVDFLSTNTLVFENQKFVKLINLPQ